MTLKNKIKLKLKFWIFKRLSISSKFNVIIFYENEDWLNNYLRKFSTQELLFKKQSHDRISYEYEHFSIVCMKPMSVLNTRALKVDLLVIEDTPRNVKLFDDKKYWLESILALQKLKINVQYC